MPHLQIIGHQYQQACNQARQEMRVRVRVRVRVPHQQVLWRCDVLLPSATACEGTRPEDSHHSLASFELGSSRSAFDNFAKACMPDSMTNHAFDAGASLLA